MLIVSVPLKNTNWDPYSGVNLNNKPTALASLPPPPSRTKSSMGPGFTGPVTLDRTTSTTPAAIPIVDLQRELHLLEGLVH